MKKLAALFALAMIITAGFATTEALAWGKDHNGRGSYSRDGGHRMGWGNHRGDNGHRTEMNQHRGDGHRKGWGQHRDGGNRMGSHMQGNNDRRGWHNQDNSPRRGNDRNHFQRSNFQTPAAPVAQDMAV